MRDEEGSGASVEERACETREGLRTGLLAASGVASRQHHPIGIELQARHLRGGEQAIVLLGRLIGRRQDECGLGSRLAKRALLKDDYDTLQRIAREQVEGGAHALDVCVATTADVGMGYAGVFDADNEGIDVDFDEQRTAPADRSRLVVDAEIGVGELLIGHGRSDFGEYEARFEGGRDRLDNIIDRGLNTGCESR